MTENRSLAAWSWQLWEGLTTKEIIFNSLQGNSGALDVFHHVTLLLAATERVCQNSELSPKKDEFYLYPKYTRISLKGYIKMFKASFKMIIGATRDVRNEAQNTESLFPSENQESLKEMFVLEPGLERERYLGSHHLEELISKHEFVGENARENPMSTLLPLAPLPDTQTN